VVRRAWDQVLDAVKSRSRPTQAALMDAQVLQVSGRTLTLAFAHPAIMRQFQGRVGADVLKEALQAVLGADLEVACTSGPAGHAPAAPPPGRQVRPPVDQPHDGFAPGDEAVPEDPDAPPPPDAGRGEDAALRLVEQELGGRVVGTVGGDADR
jgi:DNA polymerase-3 subunit gamma/tau